MIQLDAAITLLGYIGVVSVAAERVVEMAKPIVNHVMSDEGAKFAYHAVAAITGGTLHVMSGQTLPFFETAVSSAVVVGLLASGGSGVWHDLLGVLRNFKSGVPPTQ